MNSLHDTILRQGDWFKGAIEVIQGHDTNDVLSYMFELTEIENYINLARGQLTNEILDKLKQKLVWSETGEEIEFDEIFFQDCLEYDCNSLRTFRSHLTKGKVQTKELIRIHDYLTNDSILRRWDQQ